MKALYCSYGAPTRHVFKMVSLVGGGGGGGGVGWGLFSLGPLLRF